MPVAGKLQSPSPPTSHLQASRTSQKASRTPSPGPDRRSEARSAIDLANKSPLPPPEPKAAVRQRLVKHEFHRGVSARIQNGIILRKDPEWRCLPHCADVPGTGASGDRICRQLDCGASPGDLCINCNLACGASKLTADCQSAKKVRVQALRRPSSNGVMGHQSRQQRTEQQHQDSVSFVALFFAVSACISLIAAYVARCERPAFQAPSALQFAQ